MGVSAAFEYLGILLKQCHKSFISREDIAEQSLLTRACYVLYLAVR